MENLDAKKSSGALDDISYHLMIAQNLCLIISSYFDEAPGSEYDLVPSAAFCERAGLYDSALCCALDHLSSARELISAAQTKK